MSLSLVLLPAMLCDDDLYAPQTESLRDLVEARPLVVAAADMTEAVARVLQQAPPRFALAGTLTALAAVLLLPNPYAEPELPPVDADLARTAGQRLRS